MSSTRYVYEKFLETQCQSSMGCLDGLAQLKDDEVDESILLRFKEIALGRSFLAKVIKKDQVRDMDRYWVNLFDESAESVYHMLVDSAESSVLNLSQKFRPVVKSSLEETQMSMLEVSSSDADTKKYKCVEYYFYEPLKLDQDTYYSISISNFDSATNFHAQLNAEFGKFEQKFEQFQESCDCGVRLSADELDSISAVSKLAVGAKFYDDNLWYRAKILSVEDKKSVMLEFVDYGNCQLTNIEHVVYLNKEFSNYAPTAVKVKKILYTEQLNLSDQLFEQLVVYGSTDHQSEKVNWTYAMFTNKHELVVDDFYALLYQTGTLKPHFYIRPCLTDAIMSNETLDADILDVKLATIEHGLKHIYFNLKSSMSRMEKMSKQMVPLVPIEHVDSHEMFLVKNREKVFRCRVLSKSGKSKMVFYIDYGRRASLEAGMQCYQMPPSLYQFPLFALHCRLTLADNIEKVWTREEKEKFYLRIKPGNDYQIKLLSRSEPFIVEFFDKNNQIDFQFNQIINRMVQTDYEAQSIMSALGQEVTARNFVGHIGSDKFVVCAQSDRLFDKLVEFSQKIGEFVKVNEQRAKVVKQGDMYLARTSSQAFLDSVGDERTREFVRTFYSRVLIRQKNVHLNIYYIDLGLEDTASLANDQPVGYKFLQLPLQFKLQPQFLHIKMTECKFVYVKTINLL